MNATQAAATQAAATVTPITDAPKAAATRRSRASRAADKATTRKAAAPKAAPKPKAEPAGKVVITAAKGGDQTVSPRKGAIAKAIKASGSTIMAISRAHGLNPSQMRRLTLDQVAKVDLPRAEAIAAALGKPLADLFGEASDKAKAAPKATTR